MTEARLLYERIFTSVDSDSICVTLLTGQSAPRIRTATTVENTVQMLAEMDSPQNTGPLCVCPNPIEPGKPRSAKNVSRLRVLYADIDSGKPDFEQLPEPHFILKRDDSHWHVYWIIEPETNNQSNRERYAQAMRNIIAATGADPAAKDCSRLLRAPGTYHEKTGGPGYSMWRNRSDLPDYRLDDFIPQEPMKSKTPPSNNPGPIANSAQSPEVSPPEGIEDFLMRSRPTTMERGQGRSLALFLFGIDCHAWALPPDRALLLAKKWNAKLTQPEPENIVASQIRCAYRYANRPFGHLASESESSKKKERIWQRFRTEQDLRAKLSSYIYVIDAERLIDTKTGLELTSDSQMDKQIARLAQGDSSPKIGSLIGKGLVRVVDKMDFRPDIKARYYREKGLKYYNRYTGLLLDTMPRNSQYDTEAVQFFLDHIGFLTTTREEARHVLDYFAFMVQNPGKKIAHALLMITKNEGMGKSMLEELFRRMLQSNGGTRHVSAIDNSHIMSDYTDYMTDRLLCFVHETATGDRYQSMNRLKSLITEDTISINAKYARRYTVRNTSNFVFFSNLADAIKINKNTRRLFVIYNDSEPMGPEYYERLASVISHNYADIYDWLRSRDLSTFNAHARPPETEGRKQMADFSESELSIYLRELWNEKSGPFANKVVSSKEVLDWIERDASLSIQRFASSKQVRMWFLDNGFTETNVQKRIGVFRLRKRGYIHQDETLSPDDLAKMAEEAKNGNRETI